MADPHHSVDVAAGVEIRLQLHPNRVGSSHQVIKDPIGHLLMRNRAIAVAVDVKLDRLELHNPRSRLINQAQNREIGITRKGTFTGELWQLDRHLVGTAGTGVVEADQLGFGNQPLAIERGLGLLIRQGNP